MRERTNLISIDNRARIFWALASISVCCIALYFYAVLATVHNTVTRASLVKESAVIAARVSELEFKDIALRNTINIETALALGMNEVKDPLYVSRPRTSLTLKTP